MLVDITTNTELFDVEKLFFTDDRPDIFLEVSGSNVFSVRIGAKEYRFDYGTDIYGIIPFSHRIARLSKIAIYDALAAFTGKSMPWGALTGVRPTKLFYECMNSGLTSAQAKIAMQKVYRVSEARADILEKIVNAQSGKVRFPSEYYNLYIHIPYCTTRCSYCSFVSSPIDKNILQSKEYISLLCKEIRSSVDFLNNNDKKILSIYIGGGTPTALDDEAFDSLLAALDGFDGEYTCEAGRPDTITDGKASIMKNRGVTRVCVNPQTLNDETLIKIGRSHSADDFYRVFDTVNKYGFDINCDLIAGLADETPEDFTRSFEGVRKLGPQNITVHALSKKNGSAIRYTNGENANVTAMTEYALSHLGDYRPYYLYRQKRQSGNLENVGFSLPGKECINNITTMEETVGVMACGAGAISKIIEKGNIVRFANLRDIGLYLSRFDEKINDKFNAFAAEFVK